MDHKNYNSYRGYQINNLLRISTDHQIYHLWSFIEYYPAISSIVEHLTHSTSLTIISKLRLSKSWLSNNQVNHHLDSLSIHLVNALRSSNIFDVNSADHHHYIWHQQLITSSFYLRLRTDRIIDTTNELQSTELISTLLLPVYVILSLYLPE